MDTINVLFFRFDQAPYSRSQGITISGVMNSRTIANHGRRMSKTWQALAMFDGVSLHEETYRSAPRAAAQSKSPSPAMHRPPASARRRAQRGRAASQSITDHDSNGGYNASIESSICSVRTGQPADRHAVGQRAVPRGGRRGRTGAGVSPAWRVIRSSRPAVLSRCPEGEAHRSGRRSSARRARPPARARRGETRRRARARASPPARRSCGTACRLRVLRWRPARGRRMTVGIRGRAIRARAGTP
jgi:hypothetical protein